MITRVRLENWKAYRSFEIELNEGTTFLVAANGIGKSSFLEAVKWALDESAKPAADYMRRPPRTTTVEVDVMLDDQTFTIKRSLEVGRGKTPKMRTETFCDGDAADEQETFDRMAAAWRAENSFMLRAAFLTDQFVGEDQDLRTHLVRLHSLDNAQAAITALQPAAKKATTEADAARRGAAATAGMLEEAQLEAQRRSEAAEVATDDVETLRTGLTEAQQALSEARRATDATHAHADWVERTNALRVDVEQLLGELDRDTPLIAALQAAGAGARQQLLELTEERSRITERLAIVEDALGRLRDADAECPVCRRTLDNASRTHAERLHAQDHRTAAQALTELDLEAPSSFAATLRALRERAEALGEEPMLPNEVNLSVDEAALRAAEASTALESALAKAGAARQAAETARQHADELSASTGPSPAVALYARAAVFEAAKDALEATVAEVLKAQLGPVSDEVNRRWEAVFPDRPGLRVDHDGRIARTFDDDGPDLEFHLFSAGERMVSKLMLRLATLTATTDIPFCWIDEPLEHLDPDARRYVARTLAFMSGSTGLRQIFVTTYEEPLAVHLTTEAPEDVHLIFLHAAPIAS